MNKEILILCWTAASIGFLHTILGPDHYLPFIVMSKARKWSHMKTATITLLCGIGHIMSSVVLGVIGIIFGIAIMKIEWFEGFRANIAAWGLIGFGLAYFVWGLTRAIRNVPHTHGHGHTHPNAHLHEHKHLGEHTHVHDQDDKKSITPWILFTIFVFGPCEPLIPIIMYPAAKSSISGIFYVTAVFGLTTIITMIAIVMAFSHGFSFFPLKKLEKYSHALAGAIIFISGMAVQFLGL